MEERSKLNRQGSPKICTTVSDTAIQSRSDSISQSGVGQSAQTPPMQRPVEPQGGQSKVGVGKWDVTEHGRCNSLCLFTLFNCFVCRGLCCFIYTFSSLSCFFTITFFPPVNKLIGHTILHLSPLRLLLRSTCARFLYHATALPSWHAAPSALCSSRWLTWFLWSLMPPLSLAPSPCVTSPLRLCPPSLPRTPPLPPHPVPSTPESWCDKIQTPRLRPRPLKPIKSEKIEALGYACQMWNFHPR